MVCICGEKCRTTHPLRHVLKFMDTIARLFILFAIIVLIFSTFVTFVSNNDILDDFFDKKQTEVTFEVKNESNDDQNDNQLSEPLVDKHLGNNENVFNYNLFEMNEYLTDYQIMSSIDVLDGKAFKESAKRWQTIEQKAIVEALKHSWNGYREHAWGADNLKPMSKSKHNWFNVGLTILDSLDTLLMMGLEEEFNEALDWIKSDLSFEIDRDVNCFEMTIRALGGLLSAYHLSNESVLLVKAADLGERLIHCFDSPKHLVPYSDVNLMTRIGKTPVSFPDSSLSEATTIQLEFRELSYLTGIPKYERISFITSQHIHNLTVRSGKYLLPMYINPYMGQFSKSIITLGARGDSYYEYLLKQYIQTGIEWLKEDYIKAIDVIQKCLVRTTRGPLKLTFIGEILRSSSLTGIHPKMDHLVCFLSGTLALGYYHELLKHPKMGGHSLPDDSPFNEHLLLSKKLGRTCYLMYNLTYTGLSPEIAYFDESGIGDELQIKPSDAHNLLRPEYVESLFYLYHITGNPIYRAQGWQIFQSFEKYTKVSSGGFTSIEDVRNGHNVKPKDMMESFWFSETLKYFYLLFCDDKQIVDKLLKSFIFNSEGHILPLRLPEGQVLPLRV